MDKFREDSERINPQRLIIVLLVAIVLVVTVALIVTRINRDTSIAGKLGAVATEDRRLA